MADYNNPVTATLSGILNAFKRQSRIGVLRETDLLEGKTCLITGANSGLGFATAVELAKRGADIIMACRSGIPEAGEKVKLLSGNENVRMIRVDLSDLDSISSFVEELKQQAIAIDILICNAATVPSRARRTAQGFEAMFVVNYLAKFVLLNRLWNEGMINRSGKSLPRIIVISSESHRSPEAINFETFGNYQDFPMSKVVAYYGYYKLALTTLVYEFARRINENKINALVYAICPGAVNTNIAREAPAYTKPLLKVVFKLFFRSPVKAAQPVVFLASSSTIEGRSGIYLHMWTEKKAEAKALDSKNGQQLWNKSVELLKKVNQAGNRS